MGVHVGAYVDNFIHDLIHEYDPVKAREYYLRTRQLKGRGPAATKEPSKGQTPADRTKAAKEKLSAERLANRAKLEAELKKLEARLDQLKQALKQAKAEAMRRAGNVSEETINRMISAEVKSPGSSKSMGKSKDSPSTKGDDGTTPEKKTVAEKKKAAKAAREKYDKEEKVEPDSTSNGGDSLEKKVEQTAEKVEKLQKKVEAIGRVGR